MINFKFVKSQFKIIKVEIIAIFILLVIFTIPLLTMQYFSPYNIVHGNGGSWSQESSPGAGTLYMVMFSFPAMVLLPIFSILLVNKLLLKEINKGYFSCWLMAYMSRKTILNSKFFVIITSILLLNISIFSLQLILFFAIFKDFNGQMAGYLILYFLSLIFVSLTFTAIIWIISCYFCSKQATSLSLAAGILTIFVLFFIMGKYISETSGLEYFKYFKYFTIMSFIQIIEFHSAGNNQGINLGIMKAFDAKNFAWQLPLMIVSTGGLFVLGNLIFQKKDLHL